MVTVEDVAAKLGIGRNQAYDAVKSGLIPSLRLGRRWLISRRTLERLLNGRGRRRFLKSGWKVAVTACHHATKAAFWRSGPVPRIL